MGYFILAHIQARQRAQHAVLVAEEGSIVKILAPKKTRSQEEKYHAMIGDIAEQFIFCNRKWSEDDMKRLLIDQFKRDTINDPEFAELWAKMGAVEMAPALDGSGVVMLGIQSRKFPKKLAAGFIEWLYAFGTQHGVVFSGGSSE